MDWVLTGIGVTAFFLAGRKVWWCWYLNIACQVLWFIYGYSTHQYGFVASSLIFFGIFTRNAYLWTGEYLEEKRNDEVQDNPYPVGTDAWHCYNIGLEPNQIGVVDKMREDERGLNIEGVLFVPYTNKDQELLKKKIQDGLNYGRVSVIPDDEEEAGRDDRPHTDLRVMTTHPGAINDLLITLPSSMQAKIVPGSYDGRSCLVRVYGNAMYVGNLIHLKGLGDVV